MEAVILRVLPQLRERSLDARADVERPRTREHGFDQRRSSNTVTAAQPSAIAVSTIARSTRHQRGIARRGRGGASARRRSRRRIRRASRRRGTAEHDVREILSAEQSSQRAPRVRLGEHIERCDRRVQGEEHDEAEIVGAGEAHVRPPARTAANRSRRARRGSRLHGGSRARGESGA